MHVPQTLKWALLAAAVARAQDDSSCDPQNDDNNDATCTYQSAASATAYDLSITATTTIGASTESVSQTYKPATYNPGTTYALPSNAPPITTLPPAYQPIPPESATRVVSSRGSVVETLTLVDCQALSAAQGVNISDYRYVIGTQTFQQPDVLHLTDGSCAFLPTPTNTGNAMMTSSEAGTITSLPSAYQPIPPESASLLTTTRGSNVDTLTLVDCQALSAAQGVNISNNRYTIGTQRFQQPDLLSLTDGRCAYLRTPTITGNTMATGGVITSVATGNGTAYGGPSQTGYGPAQYTGGAARAEVVGAMGVLLGAGVAAVGLL